MYSLLAAEHTARCQERMNARGASGVAGGSRGPSPGAYRERTLSPSRSPTPSSVQHFSRVIAGATIRTPPHPASALAPAVAAYVDPASAGVGQPYDGRSYYPNVDASSRYAPSASPSVHPPYADVAGPARTSVSPYTDRTPFPVALVTPPVPARQPGQHPGGNGYPPPHGYPDHHQPHKRRPSPHQVLSEIEAAGPAAAAVWPDVDDSEPAWAMARRRSAGTAPPSSPPASPHQRRHQPRSEQAAEIPCASAVRPFPSGLVQTPNGTKAQAAGSVTPPRSSAVGVGRDIHPHTAAALASEVQRAQPDMATPHCGTSARARDLSCVKPLWTASSGEPCRDTACAGHSVLSEEGLAAIARFVVSPSAVRRAGGAADAAVIGAGKGNVQHTPPPVTPSPKRQVHDVLFHTPPAPQDGDDHDHPYFYPSNPVEYEAGLANNPRFRKAVRLGGAPDHGQPPPHPSHHDSRPRLQNGGCGDEPMSSKWAGLAGPPPPSSIYTYTTPSSATHAPSVRAVHDASYHSEQQHMSTHGGARQPMGSARGVGGGVTADGGSLEALALLSEESGPLSVTSHRARAGPAGAGADNVGAPVVLRAEVPRGASGPKRGDPRHQATKGRQTEAREEGFTPGDNFNSSQGDMAPSHITASLPSTREPNANADPASHPAPDGRSSNDPRAQTAGALEADDHPYERRYSGHDQPKEEHTTMPVGREEKERQSLAASELLGADATSRASSVSSVGLVVPPPRSSSASGGPALLTPMVDSGDLRSEPSVPGAQEAAGRLSATSDRRRSTGRASSLMAPAPDDASSAAAEQMPSSGERPASDSFGSHGRGSAPGGGMPQQHDRLHGAMDGAAVGHRSVSDVDDEALGSFHWPRGQEADARQSRPSEHSVESKHTSVLGSRGQSIEDRSKSGPHAGPELYAGDYNDSKSHHDVGLVPADGEDRRHGYVAGSKPAEMATRPAPRNDRFDDPRVSGVEGEGGLVQYLPPSHRPSSAQVALGAGPRRPTPDLEALRSLAVSAPSGSDTDEAVAAVHHRPAAAVPPRQFEDTAHQELSDPHFRSVRDGSAVLGSRRPSSIDELMAMQRDPTPSAHSSVTDPGSGVPMAAAEHRWSNADRGPRRETFTTSDSRRPSAYGHQPSAPASAQQLAHPPPGSDSRSSVHGSMRSGSTVDADSRRPSAHGDQQPSAAARQSLPLGSDYHNSVHSSARSHSAEMIVVGASHPALQPHNAPPSRRSSVDSAAGANAPRLVAAMVKLSDTPSPMPQRRPSGSTVDADSNLPMYAPGPGDQTELDESPGVLVEVEDADLTPPPAVLRDSGASTGSVPAAPSGYSQDPALRSHSATSLDVPSRTPSADPQAFPGHQNPASRSASSSVLPPSGAHRPSVTGPAGGAPAMVVDAPPRSHSAAESVTSHRSTPQVPQASFTFGAASGAPSRSGSASSGVFVPRQHRFASALQEHMEAHRQSLIVEAEGKARRALLLREDAGRRDIGHEKSHSSRVINDALAYSAIDALHSATASRRMSHARASAFFDTGAFAGSHLGPSPAMNRRVSSRSPAHPAFRAPQGSRPASVGQAQASDAAADDQYL